MVPRVTVQAIQLWAPPRSRSRPITIGVVRMLRGQLRLADFCFDLGNPFLRLDLPEDELVLPRLIFIFGHHVSFVLLLSATFLERWLRRRRLEAWWEIVLVVGVGIESEELLLFRREAGRASGGPCGRLVRYGRYRLRLFFCSR